MSFEPYQAPTSTRDPRPLAIFWFRLYAAAMTLVSLALAALAVMSRRGGPVTDPSSVVAFTAIALVLAAFYGIATFVPYKPWGWTWALVAIAFGVASGGAPFAIPLLLFWFKPRVKAAFARL